MLTDDIIVILHIIFMYSIILSPLIDNVEYKRLILFLLIFISFHFLTKYGKCGLINLEHAIRKDDIHNGVVFKLIKPVICYKRNPFYNYFYLILIYIFILYCQIREAGRGLNIFMDLKKIFTELYIKYTKKSIKID